MAALSVQKRMSGRHKRRFARCAAFSSAVRRAVFALTPPARASVLTLLSLAACTAFWHSVSTTLRWKLAGNIRAVERFALLFRIMH